MHEQQLETNSSRPTIDVQDCEFSGIGTVFNLNGPIDVRVEDSTFRDNNRVIVSRGDAHITLRNSPIFARKRRKWGNRK
jgi:hypothetical protein